MNKKEARKFSKTNIQKMSDAEKEWASGAIADAISSIEEFKKAHKVFIYLGTNTEPNTEEIVGLSLMMEKEVSVPRVKGDDMEAVIITPYTNFRTNKWGILEPVGARITNDIDVAVIPMVAYDGLKRLGHGKGYYDKYLVDHNCFKIGLAFDCQEISGLEVEDNDIPMDIIITEKKIIRKDSVLTNNYGDLK